jgi:hypothetical protein
MNVKAWFQDRGLDFVVKRAVNLFDRYRLSPARAIQRIESCLNMLISQDCRPTFPTPGFLVERYPKVIRHLQDKGGEIAIHSYQHIDLNTLPINQAYGQLIKAVHAFENRGIEVHGFRCPYLRFSDELLDAIPRGLFEYSSNMTISWDSDPGIRSQNRNKILEILQKLYVSKRSADFISVPWERSKTLEIPISLPDDMTLIDGLKYGPDETGWAWSQVLENTHRRGELFNLIFHPELADQCEQAFREVIRIARLCEISEWWREKTGFRMEISPLSTGLRLTFLCSPRATILVRGFEYDVSRRAWDEPYQRLLTRTLDVPAYPRPFVGLTSRAPRETIAFLLAQGYILDLGQTAHDCGIYLDEARLASLASETQLIDFIETGASPLVRYWRWPNGAKSAMSITGDLDALSLSDYLSRLYIA